MADINPTSMASQLATAYTQNAQALLTTQTKTAQSTSTSLTQLRSALSAFDTALDGLSGKSSVQQYSATFSSSAHGSATATSTATAGTYSVFVEQVATTHQIAFQDLPAVPVATGGPITVNLGDGSNFSVNLSAADQDGNGTLSQSEIALAVNQATGNGGKVTAGVVTVGGKTQLILSAGGSGVDAAITVDASGLPAGALKTALGTSTTLVAAQDAVIWLGAQGSGIKVQQGSNTFTSIAGVSMTFTQKMNTGDSPLSLTVASDSGSTAKNVQAFVDAYNTLEKALDTLTKSGDATAGTSSATFAADSGVRALRNRLTSLIRQDFGGVSLMSFGVSADRSGTLSLNTTKLNNALVAHPGGLDQLFGKTGLTTGTGLLGGLDQYMNTWLNSATGQIKSRQNSVQAQQLTLTQKQTRLDTQYDNFYERYLKQFSQLQTLQAQMSQTSGLFDALSTS